MAADNYLQERRALLHEIDRIVDEAKIGGIAVRAAYHAGLFALSYPHAFASVGNILHAINVAAKKAGVPLAGNPTDTARGP